MSIKVRIKQALKPLVLPILRRMTQGIGARVTALEVGWTHQLPAFLSAASSVRAFGHELATVRRDLERDIAALRREVADLARRLDAVAGDRTAQARAKPWIVASDKVAAATRSGIRLNLDASSRSPDGFLNVGADPLPGIDVVAGLDDLPFEPGAVLEIDAAGLLDRIAEEDLRSRYLPRWRSLIAPGGRLRATVRDAGPLVARLAAGKCDFNEFRAALLDPTDGGAGSNLFTPESLAALFEEAGFVDVRTVPVSDSTRGVPRFEISAQRPADQPANVSPGR